MAEMRNSEMPTSNITINANIDSNIKKVKYVQNYPGKIKILFGYNSPAPKMLPVFVKKICNICASLCLCLSLSISLFLWQARLRSHMHTGLSPEISHPQPRRHNK